MGCITCSITSKSLEKFGSLHNTYTTPPSLSTQRWAELVRNPFILRCPQQRGQNHKWPHHRWRSMVTRMEDLTHRHVCIVVQAHHYASICALAMKHLRDLRSL